MGIRSDLDAARKALNEALGKLESAQKAYDEKKKKIQAALKKADTSVAQVIKKAKAGGDVSDDAKQAAAAIDAASASEEKD